MRLFLIKRKSDGYFLRTLEASYSIHTGLDKTSWSPTPQMMLRTPDGIVKNLRRLCSTPFKQGKFPWIEIGWKDFDASMLDLFEVVCMDVDIISMTAVPATQFVQVEEIATIPINRHERKMEPK